LELPRKSGPTLHRITFSILGIFYLLFAGGRDCLFNYNFGFPLLHNYLPKKCQKTVLRCGRVTIYTIGNRSLWGVKRWGAGGGVSPVALFWVAGSRGVVVLGGLGWEGGRVGVV